MENNISERLLSSEVEKTNDDLKARVYEESRKIWRVALPGVLSRVASFGSIVVTQSFIGHTGELDLAAYALVQTLIVRFVNGILIGMSSATETLCGQAYGAGHYHMMGIYLQRSWIVGFITLTILLPFFIFATPIFKLVGQEESIADAAGYVSYWFIPFNYNYVFSYTIQMYLQAQQNNIIIAWLSVAQFVIHIPLSWLLVYQFEFGVPGAMIALIISSWFVVIGEFVYIFGGWCPNTWRGFTMDAFKDIFPVVKLSISSGLMLCLELWYNAALVLLAGYMKNAEVAISAFSICLNINGWEFMICLGFLGAACWVILLGFVPCIWEQNWILVYRRKGGCRCRVRPLYAALILCVAVGAGLQSTVAIINLCCYYLIGIPIGAVLGYVANLQVQGIWLGMICGVVTESIALCYMTWRTDWDNEVGKAKQRLQKFYLESDESNQLA
nr:protein DETOXIFICATION 24-like isoform X1 [Ipomoea trifida]